MSSLNQVGVRGTDIRNRKQADVLDAGLEKLAGRYPVISARYCPKLPPWGWWLDMETPVLMLGCAACFQAAMKTTGEVDTLLVQCRLERKGRK